MAEAGINEAKEMRTGGGQWEKLKLFQITGRRPAAILNEMGELLEVWM